ncbi:MAG: class II aldolase/adducin family protein, partial [Chloroflexota bacterium]
MNTPVITDLSKLLDDMGRAGRQLSEMGACEGAAGNLSICLRSAPDIRGFFTVEDEISLPQAVPGLAGAMFLVSGSGRRLREILDDPPAHLACIIVNPGGITGKLFTSHSRRFERVTSEFNSHLAVHVDQMNGTDIAFNALVHAQPLHITYLSQVPRYQDFTYFNQHLLRWQPETILNIPEGIGVIPFAVPGSDALMAGNVDSLRRHRIVLWGKHGLMARSEVSIMR